MYRVANRTAFDRCLARTLSRFDHGYEIDDFKPYWKIPELWECSLTTPVPSESVAEQLLACLVIAYRLASGWFILGSLTAEKSDGFEGIFNRESNGARSYVAGLEWASFELQANVSPGRS
jgi:hypothetical protein